MNQNFRLPLSCLIVAVLAVIWSYINPKEPFTWYLEAIPSLLEIIILAATYRYFRLSNFLYFWITLTCVMLLIGAHYTFGDVPLFNWLRDSYHLSRNHYDRIGHFMQGFVVASVAKELLLRTSPLVSGKWLFAVVAMIALGFSGGYELIEWFVAEITADGAVDFLGLQGDAWDSQKDMALGLAGALFVQMAFSSMHLRSIQRVHRLKTI